MADSTNGVSRVYSKYILSLNNPTDDPSRGIYGPSSLLLPPIPIPSHFGGLMVDYDAPITPDEVRALSGGTLHPPATQRIERLQCEQEARECNELLCAQHDELIHSALFDA